ncbi:MAG: TrkA-N domain protein [Cyanobacteria bacterium RYN_339]|nr:TrkA-N domain protein [Cyanobacteria bacterium RYN_339]
MVPASRRTSRQRITRLKRRVLFELRYLALAAHSFRNVLIFAGYVSAFATLVLHEGYVPPPGSQRLTWDVVAYNVLLMTCFGAGLPYNPKEPVLVNAVFFVLPILGLFVIISAIARFTSLLFQRRWNTKEYQQLLASTFSNHVIVGGLGHVGYRIVQQLVEQGTECVCIERDETAFIEEVIAMGVPVIVGDLRKPELLKKAQIERASALIAATDDDLVNIETCLNAKELVPGIKVVLRIFDQGLAKKIDKLVNVDYAFSTSALAAPLFAAAATTKNVINSFVVEDTVLNTVELTVAADSRLAGRTLDSLRAEFEVTFLLLQTSAGLDWNPPPAHTLQSGHKVWIVTTTGGLREIEALNQAKRLFPKW